MAFFRLKDSQGCWENPAKDQPRCALAVTVTLVINRCTALYSLNVSRRVFLEVDAPMELRMFFVSYRALEVMHFLGWGQCSD